MTKGQKSGGLAQAGSEKGQVQAISERDRRRFLELCSKFAVGMPPAISLLMSTSSALAFHDAACPSQAQGCEGDPGDTLPK